MAGIGGGQAGRVGVPMGRLSGAGTPRITSLRSPPPPRLSPPSKQTSTHQNAPYISASALRVSDMMQRPASPSFSFGGAPSPISTRPLAKNNRIPGASPLGVRPATSAGERGPGKKSSHSPLVAKRNTYDWIYGNERGLSDGSKYKKVRRVQDRSQ